MTLAYLFWHRPLADVESDDYEDALADFHASLEVVSAAFRLAALPFDPGGGYEDWYLVDGFAGLEALQAAAVADVRRREHDAAAARSAQGWGGVYALLRGEPEPPPATRWLAKPRGQSYETFLQTLASPTVWQRQLVLGPAPEFCVVDEHAPAAGRARVA